MRELKREIFDYKKLNFHVLPGKLGPFADRNTVSIYNSVFNFWQSYWGQLFNQLDSSAVNVEEFFRQDKILAITDPSADNAVVAYLCLNQFNLATAIAGHPYLSQYSAEFRDELKSRGIYSVWSGQYITVSEAYGARATRLNFAGTILSLMHRAYSEFSGPSTSLISLARKDNASANVAKKFGWATQGEPIEMHGVPVEQIMLAGTPPAPADEKIAELVEYFWKRRTEHEQGYYVETSQKIAA